MSKNHPELGQQVKARLIDLGLETQTKEANTFHALKSLETGVRQFLNGMGLDCDNDPSIQDTPRRVGEMFTNELCYGLNYDNFPKCTATPNGVECFGDTMGKIDEMVMVRNIQTISLCEHHFQTIIGVTHIAYLPGTKLLGLSKFARVTNFFARRPQVQERMTEQVYAALQLILETDDIAVYQCAVHNCMRARGAMDPSSDTITSKMGGRFLSVPALRAEFLDGIGR